MHQVDRAVLGLDGLDRRVEALQLVCGEFVALVDVADGQVREDALEPQVRGGVDPARS